MSDIQLYYDLGCPWSYLALVRVQDVADRNGCTLSLLPVDVDRLLATENPALQTTRLSANPAKAAWQRKDIGDWARLWGLNINLPADWPGNAAQAAAAATVAIELDDAKVNGIDYSLLIFKACFIAGKDINDPAILAELANEANLNQAEYQQRLAAAAETVTQRTEELIRLGGFGTPSVFVNDELYFGNDRITLVEWATGPIKEAEFVMPGQHS
jgi:2-hydroxychromene-2-carboxylate isomerase